MKKNTVSLLLLTAMVWVLVFAGGITQPVVLTTGTAILKGEITDKSDASAIPFATVTLTGTSIGTTTDADGKFEIKGLAAGTYELQVQVLGYEKYSQKNIHLKEGEVKTLKIALVTKEKELSEVVVTDEVEIMAVPATVNESIGRTMNKSIQYDMASGSFSNYSPSPNIYNGYVEDGGFNTEEYDRIYENEFKSALDDPLSTFSIDVDAASYSNMRRFITMGQMPPADAVRIEEMVNYFDYEYDQPTDGHPFAVNTEMSDCPWNKDAKLIHIGLQGQKLDFNDIKPSNLVFLIDVSGSMNHSNKLPLVKKSLEHLVNNLSDKDRIALVVYAGAAGLVLPSTPASQKDKIMAAINKLNAGGSTAGGAGIKLAYKVAVENFIENGNNRVILATDGDFNVGASSDSEMTRLIEEKRKSGVYITICGFGMGNYKDSKMEKIADKGNGNYYYIDEEKEAIKVFGTEMQATLFTIAKDVKLQIEFNPAMVKSYRLVGYENRLLNKEDFDDDTKDAGELGAGHTVTALYEIIPVEKDFGSKGEVKSENNQQDEIFGELRYQESRVKPDAYNSEEIMNLKLRYKPPKSDVSKLILHPTSRSFTSLNKASDNLKWSAAVAMFGMLLRDSKFKGDASYQAVVEMAKNAKGKDPYGYRAEFIELVKSCEQFVAAR